MSAEVNIKIIQNVYEAFVRGDVAAVLDAVADDCDWAAEAASTGAPWYGVRHGKGEAARGAGRTDRAIYWRGGRRTAE